MAKKEVTDFLQELSDDIRLTEFDSFADSFTVVGEAPGYSLCWLYSLKKCSQGKGMDRFPPVEN